MDDPEVFFVRKSFYLGSNIVLETLYRHIKNSITISMRFQSRNITFLFILMIVTCHLLMMQQIEGSSSGDDEISRGTRRTIIVNGSGTGDYIRIQDAINHSQDGDKVYVDEGLYRENIVVNRSIYLTGASRDNTIINGSGFDSNVVLIESNGTHIGGFHIQGNDASYYGIYVSGLYDVWIQNNKISNSNFGVHIINSNSIHIENNNIIGNDDCEYKNSGRCFFPENAGISIFGGNDNIIENNTVYNNNYGILICSSGNVVKNNTCKNNSYYGLNFWNYKEDCGRADISSNYNIISDNVCENNGYGLHISGSANIIQRNTFNSNEYSGMEIYGGYNEITYNICSQNGYSGMGIQTDQTRIIGNTCNNNNWYGMELYIKNTNDGIYQNTCNYNNLGGIYSENSDFGRHRDTGSSASLNNNTCNYNNGSGLDFVGTYHFLISHNSCEFNADSGISLFGSYNKIEENDLNHNRGPGINFSSGSDNQIENNSLAYNDRGIEFWDSSENTIKGNHLTYNQREGIAILSSETYSSDNNLIYDNNFIHNNGDMCQALDNGSSNLWSHNNSGNFWSDWIEPDTDENGFIDQPYCIDGMAYARDMYPHARPVAGPSIEIIVANAGANITVDQHQTMQFNGSGSWGTPSISSFEWTFDYYLSIIILYGSEPKFTFHKAGMYPVELIVRTENGSSDTDTVFVYVRDIEAPIVDAGPDTVIDQHETVKFEPLIIQDNYGGMNWSWYLFYAEKNWTIGSDDPSFRFHTVGEYLVTLEAQDDAGNRASDTLIVTVNDITPPDANAGMDIIIDQGDMVNLFILQQSLDNVGVSDWTWTFEYNGTCQTLYATIITPSSPIFTFDIPGYYIVTMNVSDEAGNFATDVINVTVLDMCPPRADAGENSVLDPNSVHHFNGISSWDNAGIVNYTWRFVYDGMLVKLYGPDPAFKFDIPGNYSIILRVTDVDGNYNEDSFFITVSDIEPGKDNEKEDIVPDDDHTWDLDDTEPVEDDNESIIYAGAIVVLSILGGVLMLIYFVYKQKRGDVKEPMTDEYGRVGGSVCPDSVVEDG